MNTTTSVLDAINLRVNGALLAVARRPNLGELDAPLRGVAMSDSPVLIRALREDDRSHVTARLHALGRRRTLPLHVCKSVADLQRLSLITSHGTWALYDVGSWSEAEQHALAKFLARLDHQRLHGNLSHERLPRIVVIEGTDALSKMCSELARRLSFFDIAIA